MTNPQGMLESCVSDVLDSQFSVTYRHRVFFTYHVDALENPLIGQIIHEIRRVLLVVESAVAVAHPKLISNLCQHIGPKLAGEPMVLPGGERCKIEETLYRAVVAAIDVRAIDRHSLVIAVGGGAFLDAVGFAAATAHRGVRLVRVPSTSLAQADSGVGVKNSLNTFGKKNFTGTFQVPYAVINDITLLQSQAPAERLAGLVEAVKVALIKDASFFDWFEAHLEQIVELQPEPFALAIRRSAEWHFRHICEAGDPFEMGSSRPLDFGHWAAHKLESLSENALSHAEAVAMGMAIDVLYSEWAGHLNMSERQRILHVLSGLGLALYHPLMSATTHTGQNVLWAGLDEFREHLGGELTILLLDAIGKPHEVHVMAIEGIHAAVDKLHHMTTLKS